MRSAIDSDRPSLKKSDRYQLRILCVSIKGNVQNLNSPQKVDEYQRKVVELVQRFGDCLTLNQP